MVQAEDGALYTIDLVAVAALNRAAALTAAFGVLLEQRNHVSDAAILRIQLDKALQFSALWMVRETSEAATAILRGERVRDLTDREGKKLTDARLVELFALQKDWVPRFTKRLAGSYTSPTPMLPLQPSRSPPGRRRQRGRRPPSGHALVQPVSRVQIQCTPTFDPVLVVN
jgi:hypothetical protein